MAFSFVPDVSVLIVYTFACAVLFLTPGPDMSLFLARTITGGRRAGMAAMAGALSGCLVHTLLAGVGLSALLAASPSGFAILQVMGAAYLLWLAFDAVRSGATLTVQSRARASNAAVSVLPTYLTGLGINLTNPKIVLFFVTFLPQFVQPGDPHGAAKLVFLGLYFVAFSLPLAVGLILVADRFVTALRTRPHLLRILDYSFAGVFSLFALKILVSEAPSFGR